MDLKIFFIMKLQFPQKIYHIQHMKKFFQMAIVNLVFFSQNFQ